MASTRAPKEVLLYDALKEVDDLDSYDAVLFTAADLNGVPRGKFAFGDGIKKFVETGMEVPHYLCALGFNSEVPTSIERFQSAKQTTSLLKPDLTTLRPLSWLCSEGRKVGHVLCDVIDSEGQPEVSSPRQVALKQLDALREFGYQPMSAHECEFFLHHKGTLDPYGGNEVDFVNLLKMNYQDHVYDQLLHLIESGVPVETLMREFAPGQFEMSMQPQYGIKMADIIHRHRYAAKSIAETAGLEASFMPRPRADFNSSGYHFNFSVWSLDGQNAFLDPKEEKHCSKFLHQWVAGLIRHAHALAALYCPTVNCYNRLHGFFAPADNIWNYDDRNATVRVKTKNSNIHMEIRTPSAACNPYLVLAATIAAGMDGIKSNLDPVPNRNFRPLLKEDDRSKKTDPLPSTLADALDHLDKDKALRAALGEQFVDEYIALVKEHQMSKTEIFVEDEKERYQAQRDMYLLAL